VKAAGNDSGMATGDDFRWRGWPYLLLGLGLFGVGLAAWRPIPAGVWHDDGVYLLIGKALAGGHGLVYDGVVGTPPAAKFPPLYPALLAALWKMLGGIGPVTLAATFLNLALLATAGALFAKALHEAAGLSLRMSLTAAGLGFAATDLLRTALVPLSEATFLFVTAVALVMWARLTDDEEPHVRPATTAGLAIVLAASVATRSAALALVIAFGLAIVLGRRNTGLTRRLMLAAAVTTPAFIVSAAWASWASNTSATIPEGARDLLGPYSNWLAEQALASPGAFAAALPSQVEGVIARAAAIFLPGLQGTPMWLVAALVAPVALFGMWRMLDRFPPLGWFTLGYFGMLVLWPYLDRRLVAPWHPLLVASVALGASELIGRVRSRRFEMIVVAGAVLWVAGFTASTAYRIADGWPTAPYRLRAERLAASVEALSRTTPDDAVVGAPEFWAALHLHGGWTVSPSVRFNPRSVDPESPMWGTADEQIALWTEAGIDHLLLEQRGQLHGAALDKLEAACPGTVIVLAEMATSMVVALDRDSDCGRGPQP
jgi:hypothetical protein